MSMTIILPKENSSIFTLINNIDTNLIAKYSSGFTLQKVNISIPKFSFTSEFKLKEVLSKMGMPDAFDFEKANFSGMSRGICIKQVIHKAYIDVNEKGSEAAAVTAVIFTKSMNSEIDYTFNAIRPFVILIKDKITNSILFIGSVINPK